MSAISPMKVGRMTPQQQAVHKRLLSRLPVRTAGMPPDEPEFFDELDRIRRDRIPCLMKMGQQR